jgi:hypothetical protein
VTLLVFGCNRQIPVQEPRELASKSEHYYEMALDTYKKLIASSTQPDKMHFELGVLYFGHGDFTRAIEEFKKVNDAAAKKYLAISFYKKGDFTDALQVFGANGPGDDEYMYYYGLTAEKLNLFEEALKAYRKINTPVFKAKAKTRLGAIEKERNPVNIKQLDPKIYSILASAPPITQYPQAGGLILYCDEYVEVTPQNTEESVLHYLIKIINERGKERFSEAHIDYDSTYEKVEIVYARVIKPDGTVVDVGNRHIRDVSKYLNFPLYSNARVYIISFPEITEGSSVEYKVKIHNNKLINDKDFMLAYPVQSDEPIIAANFTLRMPKDKKVHFQIINERYNDFGAVLNPLIKGEGASLVYKWQFKNIPQIVPETSMPPQIEVNPAILVSTFKSWDDIYNWWWGLGSPKIKIDTAIKEKVKELTRNKRSEEDKARSIYNFCAQQIRYVAVEYGQAGYEPHEASEIFRNKYGDCKDKSVLLVTMLRQAGIKAYPVLISTREYYNLNKDFPSSMFNHAIAAVRVGGRLVFLDPTAETTSFGDLPVSDQARSVLLFREDGYSIEKTPLFPASRNMLKQETRIKMDGKGAIQVRKANFTLGLYDQAQRYWILYTQPELIQQFLKEAIQNISIGAELVKYKIDNASNLDKPVVLTCEFTGPEYWTEAGALRIMPQLASLGTSLVAKDKRRYDIDFDALTEKENVYEIELPPGFAVKYMPESIKETSPWLSVSVEYSQGQNKILVKQEEELKSNAVSTLDYPVFKDFLEKTAKELKQRIVLERIKDAKK